MAIIGIDLGTTNSLVAVWQNGESVLIPNEFGEVLTPSVVSATEAGDIIVGKAAKERLVSHPECTANVFKRTMGTNVVYHLGKKEFVSEQLSAFVLQSLKKDAERFLGEEVTEAVISVPAYFDDARRQATKRAGALAGLKVERIVNEPSAAALACRLEERKKIVANLVFSIFENEEPEEEAAEQDRVYIIFDFGGGTLDVSLVECFDNMVSVVAVSGDNRLGGCDIDYAIAQAFCEENKVNFKKLNPTVQRFILKKAEECKIELTTEKETDLIIQTTELNGSMHIDYEKLIKICAPVLKRMLVPVSKVLVDSEHSIEEIDDFVLIGGSGKMPIVSRYLKSRIGKKPVTIGSPDTMVAYGLGIYAGMKERKEEIKDIVMTDICPFSLGTEVNNHDKTGKALMSVIIPRNSVLPCSRTEKYKPSNLGQRFIRLSYYQGEEYYADDNIKLGDFSFPLPPNYDESYSIAVTMTYDMNGILMVEVTDNMTDMALQDCVIKNDNLSAEQIEKAKEKLAEVKKLNEEEAEEQLLAERGERLYSVTTGRIRDNIYNRTRAFLQGISTATPLQKKKLKELYRKFLDEMDEYIDKYDLAVSDEDEENWDDLLDDSED